MEHFEKLKERPTPQALGQAPAPLQGPVPSILDHILKGSKLIIANISLEIYLKFNLARDKKEIFNSELSRGRPIILVPHVSIAGNISMINAEKFLTKGV